MFKILGLLFLLALLIVTVVFTTLNVHAVQLNYYFGSQDVPLAMVMGGTLIVGILFGGLAMMMPLMNLKLNTSKLRRNLRSNQKEISILRTQPLK